MPDREIQGEKLPLFAGCAHDWASYRFPVFKIRSCYRYLINRLKISERLKMLNFNENMLGKYGDTLQVSPDIVSLISNGYHNNLKMSQSCDFLPVLQSETNL